MNFGPEHNDEEVVLWGSGSSSSSNGIIAHSYSTTPPLYLSTLPTLPTGDMLNGLYPGDWYLDRRDNVLKVKGGMQFYQEHREPLKVTKPEKTPFKVKRLEAGERWLDI